jgi:hypothetical protein
MEPFTLWFSSLSIAEKYPEQLARFIYALYSSAILGDKSCPLDKALTPDLFAFL